MNKTQGLGRFATRHALPIAFISIALCLVGVYSALIIPSSVFPQTNFPRVVILVDNGVMPAPEMMATVTRPIEESMKDIPGVMTIRSATGRGSAEVNVFFNWKVDMVRSELYVLGRLSQIRGSLPATAEAEVYRVTFSNFPIIGISLTSKMRSLIELWEVARYNLKLRFLRIPDVARVDLVGGRRPEFHIIFDILKLQAARLTTAQVTDALARNNLVASTGYHDENHKLYLAVVDGRLHSTSDIENLTVTVTDGHPVLVRDIARVEVGPEPVFTIVTADGQDAVLLNVYSQPDGSTLDIAKRLRKELATLKRELPPDMKLAFFYDQSLLVRASVRSVWEAILFGLALSVFILFFFLKDWRTTGVAILVIPVTVLIALLSMKLTGMSFNLMTLGGIAAAIGLVIDDAIVVVEAIHTKRISGKARLEAIEEGLREILRPLVGSTLTPVVVFIPLAFLEGVPGVFFRALALTMVVSLIASLLLAVTLTPSLAGWLIRSTGREKPATAEEQGGRLLRAVIGIYEKVVRLALARRGLTMAACGVLFLLGIFIYTRLESEFLPPMDEGGFVIDYLSPPGTSLAETDRELQYAEAIIRATPEVESYSRRTGTQLGLFITEPNNGDFLLKLRSDRRRSTEEVLIDLRRKLNAALPDIIWEFPGILGDLIGDLMYAPQPVEVRIFSTDAEYLKKKAPEVAERLEKIRGVVDIYDGLIYTGPSLSFRVRTIDAQRFGLSAEDIAAAVNAAMLGTTSSYVLQGDRVVEIRVKAEPAEIDRLDRLRELPLRAPDGSLVKLSQVADVIEEPGQLELRRDDLRQDVAVTARLEGRDLGSAMAEIQDTLAKDVTIPPGTIEYAGLYEQQRQSFQNLVVVLAMAIFLVFTVLLLDFRSFYEPMAIIFGAVLAMFGTVAALWLTGTSLNIVSLLGAIIGIGIVAKNGILMLDFVRLLRAKGVGLEEALIRSGRRRLRPVLMTSLAAALGMLPLAYGIGAGADMLQPLAVAVIGALTISVLLSLVATPTLYFIMLRRRAGQRISMGRTDG
jgi:CzcA family heavy metal efflux pump